MMSYKFTKDVLGMRTGMKIEIINKDEIKKSKILTKFDQLSSLLVPCFFY